MKTHETDLVSSCKCYHFEFLVRKGGGGLVRSPSNVCRLTFHFQMLNFFGKLLNCNDERKDEIGSLNGKVAFLSRLSEHKVISKLTVLQILCNHANARSITSDVVKRLHINSIDELNALLLINRLDVLFQSFIRTSMLAIIISFH